LWKCPSPGRCAGGLFTVDAAAAPPAHTSSTSGRHSASASSPTERRRPAQAPRTGPEALRTMLKLISPPIARGEPSTDSRDECYDTDPLGSMRRFGFRRLRRRGATSARCFNRERSIRRRDAQLLVSIQIQTAPRDTCLQYPLAMREPLRLSAFPLVAVAILLASGCGSSKKPNAADTTSANATTSAPAHVTGQTKSPAQTQPTTTARKPKAAHTKSGGAKAAPAPTVPSRAPSESQEAREARRVLKKHEATERAAKTLRLDAVEQSLPPRRRLPKEIQGKFMQACRKAKGSQLSCECVVAKQELRTSVEIGRLVAELLAVEIAFQNQHASLADVRNHRVLSPAQIRKVTNECK